MGIFLDKIDNYDSKTFRKIFEFIKEYGVGYFIDFLNDIDNIKRHRLIDEAIFKGENHLTELIKKNKVLVKFFKQFEYGFLHNMRITDNDFFDFIMTISKNMDNLDLYLENSRKLEELKICNINLDGDFNNFKTQIWTQEGNITNIRKQYSDGEILYTPAEEERYELITYQEFKTIATRQKEEKINNPTWVITAQNNDSGWQYRYITIKDFAFNSENLPTNEELSSYEEPLSLKLYRNNRNNVL